MREILFRGKRVDNDEWVQGSYVNYRTIINTIDYIVDESGDKYLGLPKTVGQYTGLKDKNGTRIFEGDILIYVVDGEYDVNEKYLVVFDNDEAAFRTKFYCEGKYRCYEDIIPCENFEVIGNIHDNPELLEGE